MGGGNSLVSSMSIRRLFRPVRAVPVSTLQGSSPRRYQPVGVPLASSVSRLPFSINSELAMPVHMSRTSDVTLHRPAALPVVLCSTTEFFTPVSPLPGWRGNAVELNRAWDTQPLSRLDRARGPELPPSQGYGVTSRRRRHRPSNTICPRVTCLEGRRPRCSAGQAPTAVLNSTTLGGGGRQCVQGSYTSSSPTSAIQFLVHSTVSRPMSQMQLEQKMTPSIQPLRIQSWYFSHWNFMSSTLSGLCSP